MNFTQLNESGDISATKSLGPDRSGRGVSVGKAVDTGSGILEHGGPEVGQWSVFIWGEPVLTVGKSFKAASGEQAGYIGVAVSRT